jgi:hypothetical protein
VEEEGENRQNKNQEKKLGKIIHIFLTLTQIKLQISAYYRAIDGLIPIHLIIGSINIKLTN